MTARPSLELGSAIEAGAMEDSDNPENGTWSRTRSWGEKYRLMVFSADFVAISLVIGVSYVFRFSDVPATAAEPVQLVGALLLGIAWFVLLSITESRSLRHFGAGLEEYRRVIRASFYAFGAIAIGSYLLQSELSRFYFAVSLPLGLGLLLAGRWSCRMFLARLRASGRALTPAIIIGKSEQVDEAVQDILRHSAAGYLPVAISILPTENDRQSSVAGLPQIPFGQVHEAVTRHSIGAVVVAGGLSRHSTRELSWGLDGDKVQLLIIPRIADVAGPRIHMRTVESLGLMQVGVPRYSGWNYHLKRAFDVVFSSVALLLLSPLLLVIAILIKRDDGGPVIFRQQRVGQNGKPFTIHKFRTMCVDAESKVDALIAANGGKALLFKMEDDPRVTKLGAFLRKYSLDELPQFWSALRGGMSVVGPRPQVAREVAEYTEIHHRRLLIKPGITGLWQVNGRSGLSLEEAIRLDLRYVENWSLTGDIIIILKTFRAVIHGSHAY